MLPETLDPLLRHSEDMEMGQRLFDQGVRFVFEPQATPAGAEDSRRAADGRSEPPVERNRAGEGSIEDEGCIISGARMPKSEWRLRHYSSRQGAALP